MRSLYLLSVERPAATCRTCKLVLPCRHDSALLLSAADALLLLDALRSHRQHVPCWQAERLAELGDELAASFHLVDRRTSRRPRHLHAQALDVVLAFPDAAE